MQPLHQASPAELKARLDAERSGSAFLIVRDAAGAQQIMPLDPTDAPVTIGRGSAARIRLGWDREVSRPHAEINCLDGHWTLSDNGLSRNGTFLNGRRTHLRALFRRFGIEDLPQNEKRLRLVELLLRFGIVGEDER